MRRTTRSAITVRRTTPSSTATTSRPGRTTRRLSSRTSGTTISGIPRTNQGSARPRRTTEPEKRAPHDEAPSLPRRANVAGDAPHRDPPPRGTRGPQEQPGLALRGGPGDGPGAWEARAKVRPGPLEPAPAREGDRAAHRRQARR